ncbi:MAG: ABC transporter permease [bacterium]|nr:ABC transporter permease [bacterium]
MLKRFFSKLTGLQQFQTCIALSILLLGFLLAAYPTIFQPLDPFAQQLHMTFSGPSEANLLGCDHLGRDLYSRIIYGAKYSLLIGLSVATLTIIFPVIISSLILFSTPIWNQVYLFVLDVFLVFPPLLLAILITASSSEPSSVDVILALSLAGWAANGRLIRSYLMQIQGQDFVLAAQSLGASSWRIYFNHLIPNILNQLIVLWSFRCGQMILAEATLSFLGLGGGPDNLSWGWLVLEGKAHLTSAWILSLAPATAIALLVYAFQVVGEALEKILFPQAPSQLLKT